MPAFPHHESLTLANFTAFAEARFEFSPTVNILVGENGTGKTHLMKVLYAVQYASSSKNYIEILTTFRNTFQINNSELLVRDTSLEQYVEGRWAGNAWFFAVEKLADGSPSPKAYSALDNLPRPVFIPAIDMMAHTRRFLSTYDNYKIAFDPNAPRHRFALAVTGSPRPGERQRSAKNACASAWRRDCGGERTVLSKN